MVVRSVHLPDRAHGEDEVVVGVEEDMAVMDAQDGALPRSTTAIIEDSP